MEIEDIKISKHSSGVSIIIRVDQLWKNCHSFKRSGQYQKWNEELDSIWLELARDLKNEENKGKGLKSYDELKKSFDEFDINISKIGVIKDTKPAGFAEISEKFYEKRNEHYKQIMEKQLFLARLENILGKGTTFDDEEDDWED